MTAQLHSWEQSLLALAFESDDFLFDQHHVNTQDEAALQAAYAHCEAVTSEHSRSFFMASGLLPAEKCRAARALYAFCRVTDDIVDAPTGDVEANLHQWRMQVEHGRFSVHPEPDEAAEDLTALAWTDTRHRYAVPARYMTQLIDGVARDLRQTRYDTFSDLAAYSYGVASTVGLMSMHIIGYTNEEALPYAIKLGVALQITNILRDVGQDWRMGRVYLPKDELSAFGINDDYLENGIVDNRWRAFMRFQINRNRRLYQEAWPGIEMLNPDGRFAIAAAADLYRAILIDIERNDYNVFNRRAYISKVGKLRRLPALWFATR